MRVYGIWGLALIAVIALIAIAWIGPAGTKDVPVSRGDGEVSAGPTGGYVSGTGATPAPDAEERFARLSREVFSGLPRRSELQGLSEEGVHNAPEPVERAGRLLGRVAQALADNPSLAPQVAAFYQDCASSGELLNSVRALCYSNMGVLGIRAESETVPAEVRELAARLKDWR